MLTNVTEGKKVNFDNCCSESVMILKEPDQDTFKLFLFKAKCVQYWPDSDEDFDCDVFTITTTHQRQYANYVIRKMKIWHTKVMSPSEL